VSEAQINTKLFAELAQVFQLVVTRDCPGPGPDSCESGSSGENIQGLFDENNDLSITLVELQGNGLMQSVFSPDLDLVKADGTPGTDGVSDAVSLGVGFRTVRATLVRP
jgi:hypothetical protein